MIKSSKANRIHIGIFGKTNSGKSTILNLITDQKTSIVSEKSGTTTDPVYKAMEILNLGPVTFIDTAGFDDNTELGEIRESRTKKVLDEIDIGAIVIRDGDINYRWIDKIYSLNKPLFFIFNDYINEKLEIELKNKYKCEVVNKNRIDILNLIRDISKEKVKDSNFLDNIVQSGDMVLLVMPQDIQAPKGRLILPQVQTIRAILDSKCICISTTFDNFKLSLSNLKKEPNLIITDSQLFKEVYDLKPKKSKITSFSILQAKSKSDIKELIKGANKVESMNENSKILISEACTHAPVEEDIGRYKIPSLLKKRLGDKIKIDFARGIDFPENLKDYDLIIMCGSCMFNKAIVEARINRAKDNNVAVTNYGIIIAKLKGILEKIDI